MGKCCSLVNPSTLTNSQLLGLSWIMNFSEDLNWKDSPRIQACQSWSFLVSWGIFKSWGNIVVESLTFVSVMVSVGTNVSTRSCILHVATISLQLYAPFLTNDKLLCLLQCLGLALCLWAAASWGTMKTSACSTIPGVSLCVSCRTGLSYCHPNINAF